MQRSISWPGAFSIASGVPALMLFSIGSIFRMRPNEGSAVYQDLRR
ncbi:MAG: hypothetical protein H0U22_16500 [Geodermatophilaceae bacterium]|nr:hypothetical protein [Geodermatophilaceae bacterium]